MNEWLTLEQAEAMAAEIAARRPGEDEHKRPDVLRREDAILVLWQALEDMRRIALLAQQREAGDTDPTR